MQHSPTMLFVYRSYIIVIAAIGLTALCYVRKSMVVLTLSFIIVLLLNTVVMHEWLEFCSERLGTRCF